MPTLRGVARLSLKNILVPTDFSMASRAAVPFAILMGMSRPVHVLQRTATVEVIVNVAAIAVVDAQENGTHTHSRIHVSVEPQLIG